MLDSNGFTIKSYTQILTDVQNELVSIYGTIDFNSSTPAANLAQLFAKAKFDSQMQTLALYNNLSLNAEGVFLDRIAFMLYRIKRKGSAFTKVNIQIITDRTVTLAGEQYTIKDTQGLQYILENTITLNTGTHFVSFRAENFGNIIPILNTITQPVTIVLGVVSVNNPSVATQIGSEIETDIVFRERISKIQGINASGGNDSLYSALINIQNVTDVRVYINREAFTVNTIPSHSVWIIVEGGDNQLITNTIAIKNSFAGMKGDTIGDYLTIQGTTEQIRFDRPNLIPIYIRGNIQYYSGNSIDVAAVKQDIATLTYKIGEIAESSLILTMVRNFLLSNNTVATPFDFQISYDNITYVEILQPLTLRDKFIISINNIQLSLV